MKHSGTFLLHFPAVSGIIIPKSIPVSGGNIYGKRKPGAGYLDCLTYEGKEYLVLMPADEPSTEIVILEVEPVDEENENYLAVEDEAILDAVYGLFKEKYKDILTFEEE